jgi:hypothetical protein
LLLTLVLTLVLTLLLLLLLLLTLLLIFRIETLPNETTGIRIKRGNLSERSEFVSPPDWQTTHLGT